MTSGGGNADDDARGAAFAEAIWVAVANYGPSELKPLEMLDLSQHLTREALSWVRAR